MFDFFKKDKDETVKKIDTFIEIACLLIHASKIDEIYTEEEKEIIKKTLIKLGSKDDEIEDIINKAETIESDSNQILNFTRTLKNVDQKTKIMIVESLWEIIYSDNKSDMYEANLMRRLTGLLYLNPKEVGDLKEKIKKTN